jgi:hypothetical protein
MIMILGKEYDVLQPLCAIYLPHYITKYPWPALVFGHDMILIVKHEANWEYIHAQKQNITIQNYKAENAKRIPHAYNVGEDSIESQVTPKVTRIFGRSTDHLIHVH